MSGKTVVLLLSAVSCGGRVADTDQSPRRDPAGASSGGGAGSTVPTTALPPCEPGPLPSERAPGDSCAWVDHEGRCYAEKIDACACVCRAVGGKNCLSSFPGGPNDMVAVDCY